MTTPLDVLSCLQMDTTKGEIMKIHGQEAIDAKEQDDKVILNHYTTALEGGAENITLELAEEIAAEDPGLIWCEEECEEL